MSTSILKENRSTIYHEDSGIRDYERRILKNYPFIDKLWKGMAEQVKEQNPIVLTCVNLDHILHQFLCFRPSGLILPVRRYPQTNLDVVAIPLSSLSPHHWNHTYFGRLIDELRNTTDRDSTIQIKPSHFLLPGCRTKRGQEDNMNEQGLTIIGYASPQSFFSYPYTHDT